MSRVNIIYHHFPHYRGPVLRELVKSGVHEYRFFGSHDDISGIRAFKGDELVTVSPLGFSNRCGVWLLKGYWQAVMDRTVDALIIIGNPNMPASWFAAVVGRLTGKKVLFWAHGWLKPESFVKRVIRNFYFGLANRVLVYGERAVLMADQSGFGRERVRVIYNSLDYDRALNVVAQIENGDDDRRILPQSLFKVQTRPVIICTARLTHLCRFDLLLDAAAILKRAGTPVNILLVGDGPERRALEESAQALGVTVHFFGACYDEEILGSLIYHSDITVSPGKIGLTVIHSLTYGTPAITHGDMDEQMPEAEAIEPGRSGLFFTRDDAQDLSTKISEWLGRGVPRELVRKECQRVIAEKWNPSAQRRHIEAALNDVLAA